ncbi:MAG: response regulator [Anaerolineae bacterium]
MSLRILVVDDHVLVRAGLAFLLNHQQDIEVVGEVSHSEEAVSLAYDLIPDVVIMAVNTPDGGGIEATRQIKARRSLVHVLILTPVTDKDTVRAALDAGASGYLLKRASVAELLNAIRTITCGGLYVDSTVGRAWFQESPTVSDPHAGATHALTPRQTEVLRLIAEGYTTVQIAAHLVISARTVEYHRRILADKLHVRNRAELVHYAFEQGLLSSQGAQPNASWIASTR